MILMNSDQILEKFDSKDPPEKLPKSHTKDNWKSNNDNSIRVVQRATKTIGILDRVIMDDH